ncbi:hypothetical protein POPTR_011G125451v4 [Populus trichocarpa]|uniref:Uncharacterized protein n=1 Tax=Populus trichocarpa TaxID=3694 RepID=A0ACC0S9R3_POPTR|nr:hypothetical protein POPTR_011G125451v4 [Populus trichocarpa]
MLSGLLSFPSLTTRLPVSKRSATESSAVLDEFDDQTISFVLLYRTSIPLLLIFRAPKVLESGTSLFATHITVRGDFLYHIPKKRFVEFPGLKNPSSNFPPVERRVAPSLMDWLG